MANPSDNVPKYSTHLYKTLPDGSTLTFDFYPPSNLTESDQAEVPSILFFHGGGLILGDARSWFPKWLQERANDLGYAFISAEYRLLLPVATAHDILEDVKDVFNFIGDNPKITHRDPASLRTQMFVLDPKRVAVAGSSAGGWLAYLAAAHCQENPSRAPKAIISIYGMGGDLLQRSFVEPKTEPFFFDLPPFDIEKFKQYFHPIQPGLIQPSNGEPENFVAELPTEGRVLIVPLYLQTGTHLDYATGQHEPSLSKTLREVWQSVPETSNDQEEKLRAAVPETQRKLFPNFLIPQANYWPPTLTFHGTEDTVVPVEGSRNIGRLVKAKGAEIVSIEVKGQHGMDLGPDAEQALVKEFEVVAEFLKRWV